MNALPNRILTIFDQTMALCMGRFQAESVVSTAPTEQPDRETRRNDGGQVENGRGCSSSLSSYFTLGNSKTGSGPELPLLRRKKGFEAPNQAELRKSHEIKSAAQRILSIASLLQRGKLPVPHKESTASFRAVAAAAASSISENPPTIPKLDFSHGTLRRRRCEMDLHKEFQSEAGNPSDDYLEQASRIEDDADSVWVTEDGESSRSGRSSSEDEVRQRF